MLFIFIRVETYFSLSSGQLAGANRPIALANANAILRRVELVCEVFTMPFSLGLLFVYLFISHCMLCCMLLLIRVSLYVLMFHR